MSVQAVMWAHAGEFGTAAPQGHDDRTGSTAAVGRRPHSDETALPGNLDTAGTDENVTHIPPEAHFDTRDPWGRDEGAGKVKTAGKAEDAPAVAHVEHIDVDRIVP
ncbi:hypothetical protein ACFZCY_23330 [Streptomyces sp. NPDC007983]|uniref:hypothetical protein n=1 Tax=Streptomyces sp. NPDC007983 TaxID=3364800 RepID=UPI0036E99D2A